MGDVSHIRRNLQGLSVLGLWDVYEFKNFKKVLFFMYNTLIVLYLIIFNISQFIAVYFVKNDVIYLMQSVGLSIQILVLLLKMFIIINKKDKFTNLIDQMRSEEQRILKRSDKEIKIFYDAVDLNWSATKFVWITYGVAIWLMILGRPLDFFVTGPMERHHNKVPYFYNSWAPFDKYASGYFELLYSFQVTTGLIMACGAAVTDTFCVAFMIFARGQFQTIQCSLERLHILSAEEEKKRLNESGLLDVYNEVIDIIKHHVRTIEFLKSLDALINPIVFFSFIVCTVMIITVGLELVMTGVDIRIIQTAAYLFAILVQLFVFYWHANEVTLESYMVGKTVPKIPWFNFSKQSKQALQLLMARAERPSELSVGGFYPMSLNTFLMILRGIYSYIALFRRVYARNENLDM